MNGVCQSGLMGTDCSTVVLPRLCFISSNDECRGPMAAAVYNHFAGKKGLSWRAVSAGLSLTGCGISVGALDALEAKGIKLSSGVPFGHMPFEVTDAILGGCELAVCVCFDCADKLAARFPAYSHKILTLSKDIFAVSGESPAAYRRCLDELISVIRKDFGL